MTTDTIYVTEDGATFPQFTGGIWTATSAKNLALRYAALTAGQDDPPPVLWLNEDPWTGYNADGHLVATIWRTRTGRYAATLGQRFVTTPEGATTLEGAQAVVAVNVEAHR